MRFEDLRGVMDHPFTSSNAVLTEALESEDGVPEWLQLTPSRGKFEGRDGRRFNVRSPRAIAKAFNDAGEDIQLDLDHASEMPSMFGGTSAAVGWVTEMQSRNGGQIWAKVEWTPQGEDLVRNRTFRGLSPVFRVTQESVEAFLDDPKKNAMEVEQILSVALTNRPNLRLKSLNTQGQHIEKDTHTMDLGKLLLALGLNTDASEADVLKVIADLRTPAEPSQANDVDLSAYVAKADYVQLNDAYTKLREKVAADEKASFEAERNAAIEDALKSGKIAPASEGFYRDAVCHNAAGLASFRKEMEGRAPIVKPDTEEANKDETVSQDSTKQANDEAAAAAAGVSVEAYQAARERLRAAGEIN